MTNTNNLKPIIENKKPFETVYDLKNEIPSFEEFMKTYENDGNLNYDDLGNSDIGTDKGYGPTGDGRERKQKEGSVELSGYRKGVFSMGGCEASGKIGTVKGNLGGEYPEMRGEASCSAFRIKD